MSVKLFTLSEIDYRNITMHSSSGTTVKRFFKKARYYYTKHGLVRLAFLSFQRVWRRYIDNAAIVYCIDTRDLVADEISERPDITIERFSSFNSIPEHDLKAFYGKKGGEAIVGDFLMRFFDNGAELWFVRMNGVIVGYHWSVKGGFNGFYNFPLTDRDCVLVAGEVFPEYRGQGVNPVMIKKISLALKNEGISKIYIGSKTWNKPQLRSLPKTGFKRLGRVRSVSFFGKVLTIWYNKGKSNKVGKYVENS